MKLIFAVISTAFLFSISAFADGAPPYDINSLLSTMESAKFDASSKIDDLIPLLPEAFRSNMTFKYSNGFDDSGTVKPSLSASEQFPRAFLWDDLTGFIFSFNGNADQDGYQDLEMMQWEPKTATTHFITLNFPLKPNYSTTEPDSCLECHGAGSRPIWKMYPLWPGIVGSINDELVKKPKPDPGDSTHAGESVATFNAHELVKTHELALYHSFAQGSLNDATHDRYKSLFATSNSETYPYRSDSLLSPADIPSRAFTTRPNLRVGILLNRYNVLRLTRKILEDPIYREFKEAIVYNWMDCNWNAMDPTAKASLFARFKTALAAQSRNVDLVKFSAAGSNKDINEHLRALGLRLSDIDIRATDTPGAQKTIYSKLGYGDSYFDGTATANELFVHQLLGDISADQTLNSKGKPYAQKYYEEGITSKYEHLKNRFVLDQTFFGRADDLSLWFPLPFPPEKLIPEHREAVVPAAAAARVQACIDLRTHMAEREQQ